MLNKLRRLVSMLLLATFFSIALSQQATVSYAQDCPETRLEIGGQARVTPGAPNRVRSAPSTSGELVGEIPPGSTFDVLDGPECADGFLWWNVDFEGLVGWTVEGNADGYFVEPVSDIPPTPVTPAAPADCAMSPRLEVGREGKTTSNTPSRLRDNASASAEQVGQIDPLDTFTILEGPVCFDGINWWRVDASGAIGWTAEGVDGAYLIEMLELVPTATPPYIGLPNARVVAWNADGSLIAVGTSDGVYLFDAQDFSAPPAQFLPGAEIDELAFHPVEANLLALAQFADENSSAAVYDIETGDVVLSLASKAPVGIINGLTFTDDGTAIALNARGGVVLLDTETGGMIASISLPDWSNGELAYMGAMNLTVSPDGLLFGVYDGLVRLLKVDSPTEPPIDLDRDIIEASVSALDFSPDSKNLIVGDTDGNLQMWNVETLERTSFIRGQRSNSSNYVGDLRFNPDGTVLYTVESDPHAVIRAFNAQSLQQVNVLDFGPNTSTAVALAFNPDATQVAVIVDDTVRIVDIETFSEVAQLVLGRN